MAKYICTNNKNQFKSITAQNHDLAVREFCRGLNCTLQETSNPAEAQVQCQGAKITKYYKLVPKADASKYGKVGQAMAYLTMITFDMSDSPTEFLAQLAEMVECPITDIPNRPNPDVLESQFAKYYTIAADRYTKHFESNLVSLFVVDAENTFDSAQMVCCAEKKASPRQTKVFAAVSLLYSYAKAKRFSVDLLQSMSEFLKELNSLIISVIGFAEAVVREYIFRLDSSIFGTLTNDYFTTGHRLTQDEKRTHKIFKEYAYVNHKGFNVLERPQTPICMVWKGEATSVVVDIFLGRSGYTSDRTVSVVGYIKHIGTLQFSMSDNIKSDAEILARKINEVGAQVRTFVKDHPEFLQLLPVGQQPEWIG